MTVAFRSPREPAPPLGGAVERGCERLEPSLALALERVRLRAQRRCAWLDRLRAEGQEGDGPLAIRRLVLEHRDDPEREAHFYASDPRVHALTRRLLELEAAREDDRDSALAGLARTFELSAGERDLLEVALCLALEPRLASIYAELQQNPELGCTTETLAARLCGRGYERLSASGGPLFTWELLHAEGGASGAHVAWTLDRYILDVLTGTGGLDPELLEHVEAVEAHRPPQPDVGAEACRRVLAAWEAGMAVRHVLLGPIGSGRRSTAAWIARHCGLVPLAIDTTLVSDADWPRIYRRAQRQALLLGCCPIWTGARVSRPFPRLPAVAALQFVIGDRELELAASGGVLDERLQLPELGRDERLALWRRLVVSASSWPALGLETIVDRYRLQVGDIAALGRHGPVSPQTAAEYCRRTTRHRLGELAQVLDCPFTREDLVLPQRLSQLLDAFLFEARTRQRFWETTRATRLFPRGTGLVALLAGPAGTGKTMAAQVIAAELGLDLVRIDLGSVSSKYIGETAKNLREIFRRAVDMNAVLLFDEADALFSRRTDVRDSHDRYANSDTNYLLQLIEDFAGVAVLASNKRHNLDTAFMRRIRYQMDFPAPTEAERQRIWQRLARELAGEPVDERLDAVLSALSTLVDVSGAQIKQALVTASFAALERGERLGASHLLAGVERELTREGRTIAPRDRERMLRHG